MLYYRVYNCEGRLHICLKNHFRPPCNSQPIKGLNQNNIDTFLKSLGFSDDRISKLITEITFNYCARIPGISFTDDFIPQLENEEDE